MPPRSTSVANSGSGSGAGVCQDGMLLLLASTNQLKP
jgi:hypothetical protein